MSYNALYRSLSNGSRYDGLIPEPKDTKKKLSSGDTYTSMQLIVDWALKHNNEVSLVAPLFNGANLEQTCKNIHSFLYNHFQYEADGEAQLLRSPAYAWKYRENGIDCKSYSIIASAILLQLNKFHYIRKIKQAAFNPESFSHVYVIVPKNQTTGSLSDGYYTIDGTLPTTQEPQFLEKYDFFMEKLPHYGLAGLASVETELLLKLISKINFEKIGTIFNSPISCWGGSAFDDDLAEPTSKQIVAYLTQILQDINISAAKGDYNLLSQLDVEFHQAVAAGICGYEQKWSENNWNDCTIDGLKRVLNILYYYRDIVIPAYKIWSENYFDKQKTGYSSYNNHLVEAPPAGFYFAYTGKPCTVSVPIYKYSIKNLVRQLRAFTLTPYLEEMAKDKDPNLPFYNGKIDINKYLSQLDTVISVFGNSGSSGNGSVDGGEIVYDEKKPTNKQSSMGGLVVGLAVFGLFIWGLNKFKNDKR